MHRWNTNKVCKSFDERRTRKTALFRKPPQRPSEGRLSMQQIERLPDIAITQPREPAGLFFRQ